jgi:hypothetical protein
MNYTFKGINTEIVRLNGLINYLLRKVGKLGPITINNHLLYP